MFLTVAGGVLRVKQLPPCECIALIAAVRELNFAIVVLDVDISAVVEVRVMLQLFCGTTKLLHVGPEIRCRVF